ncbi:hypothetical protein F0562_025662 [Nyssa sinensis]|uniref:C2 domain-containing protein n=1 Tax=Nyssa sinensis TaxID=561372 RepID=A0A5J5B941_9ASTE|nr:hypothetical protein F0562_025662 [Nyssa sinensis]
MGPTTPSTTTSSDSSSVITTATGTTATTTSSDSSSSISLQFPFQLLEITLISAQDLAPVSRSMRTYAVAWVHPDRKLRTRVDQQGNANPTWNDKFLFRVDDKFLNSDTSSVIIEIYTQSWIRDTLVGTVRILITNLLPASMLSQNNTQTRFVALQIRRPSGSPQGILNMGVSLLDTSIPNMPLGSDEKLHKQDLGQSNDEQEGKEQINEKIQLWRSRSEADINMEEFPQKGGSVCNGSICDGSAVNGSELCSDVGPSASVVAAAIAHGLYPLPKLTKGKPALLKPEVADDTGSSILEDLTFEEATAKGYKSKMESWRPAMNDHDTVIIEPNQVNTRRHSDGGGLFSCFGNAYGFEFTIVGREKYTVA